MFFLKSKLNVSLILPILFLDLVTSNLNPSHSQAACYHPKQVHSTSHPILQLVYGHILDFLRHSTYSSRQLRVNFIQLVETINSEQSLHPAYALID